MFLKGLKRFSIHLTFLLLGWVLFPQSVEAQEFNFKNFSLEEGLSQSVVNTFIEDQRGFLWLGTEGGGLNRFDGKNFKTYTKGDGLPSNTIYKIYEDLKGHLWLGMGSQGIARFDGLTFKRYLPGRGIEAGLAIFFAEDHTGTLWANCSDELFRFEEDQFVKIDSTYGVPPHIRFIHPGKDGNLYLSGEIGLYIWNGSRFEAIPSLVDEPVIALDVPHPDTILFMTTNILKMAHRDTVVNLGQALVGAPQKIFRDRRGWIWIAGSFQLAVYQNDTIVSMRHESGLWDVGVADVIEDREGNLWVGTIGGGISRFLGESFVHFSQQTPLHRNAVFSIEEVQPDVFWIGSEKGLFQLANNEITEITIPDEPDAPFLQKLSKAPDGSVYIGSVLNIYHSKNGQIQKVKSKHPLLNLTSPQAGLTPMVKSVAGFCELKDGEAIPYEIAGDPNQLNGENLYRASNGDEWIIHRYNQVTRIHSGGLDTFTTPNSLLALETISIVEDRNGHIWLGSNEGISKFDGESFCYLTYADGLAGLTIFILIEGANGDIWAGTERGLSRIQIDDQSNPISITNFGRNEGFLGMECNESAAYVDHRGRLWIGTIYGLTCYDPSVPLPPATFPQIHLLDIQIDNQAIDWTTKTDSAISWFGLPDKADLSAKENRLRFEFQAAGMRSPDKIRFQYKLSGLEDVWSPPGPETSVNYPELPPGQYTFLVRAGYEDGLWNPEPASFSFYIPTPFYRTMWFRILALAALVSLVVLIVRIRISNIVRQRRLLKEKVQKRTQELEEEKNKVEQANRVKSEFLAKMSHEIRTPMNGVIGMTELLRRSSLNGQQTRYVDNIYLSGQNLLNLINDILDFSRIESGKLILEETALDIRTLIEEVLDILGYSSYKKNLELLSYVDPEIRGPIIGDPARIKQILINLVGNAIKFTNEGQILVETKLVRKTDSRAMIQLTVQDSGIGIPKEKFATLFESFSQVDASTTRKYGGTGLGLAISYQLSQMMGGDMWVDSENGKGSKFHFSIDVGISAPWNIKEDNHPATQIQGKSIFIAIKDPLLQKVLQRYAAHWGLKIRLFDEASHLLEQIKSEAPYFVLLDARFTGSNPSESLQPYLKAFTSNQVQFAILLDPRLELLLDSDTQVYGTLLYKPLKRDHLLRALSLEKQSNTSSSAFSVDPEYGHKYPLNILVAEDNPINQEVIGGMLATLGYSAKTAENGREVLEACRKELFDLILMDVQMPEMDGLEATRRLRKEFANQAQPLIFAMTANAMEADRKSSVEAGMDGFLSKPFLIGELFGVMQEVASQRSTLVPGIEKGEQPQKESDQDANSEKKIEPDKDQLTDLSMLMNASGGQTAFVKDIVGKLVDRLPESIAELHSHTSVQNWDQVRAVAHKNKSSSAYTGSEALKDMFKELEFMAREERDLEQIPEKINRLEAFAKRVVEELKDSLANLE